MSTATNAFHEYTKLPVVIEAAEYTQHYFDTKETLGGIVKYDLWGKPFIETLEGNHLVSIGDMIIRGVRGEYYPCKREIFDLTYRAGA